MLNFEYVNGTKIIFGREQEKRVGEEAKAYGQKVLLHYGGGSVIKSGLYDRVLDSLREAGLDIVELGGVKPNPRLSLVEEGVALCRQEKVDFILAVGGGSVIDSAKAIAAGTIYKGDLWDFFIKKESFNEALPVGTILTIPAAGSESSTVSVITNEDGWYKRSIKHECLRPKFSILNPELAFTLPPYQIASGATDILAHLMERYFTDTQDVELMDGMLEAAMKTVIKFAPIVLYNPKDYDAWAELMWTGALAHNGLLNTGRLGDWGPHGIAHELSAKYDVAHGASLAAVYASWMRYVYQQDVNRFAKFAERVFHVEYDYYHPERTVEAGIQAYEDFVSSLGMPTRLYHLDIPKESIPEMVSKTRRNDLGETGMCFKLLEKDVFKIYELMME